jgi:hypothetical protein
VPTTKNEVTVNDNAAASTRTLPAADDGLVHGRLSTYTHHKCRCLKCTVRMNAWEANRRRQKAYGRWQPYVDAPPVRAHVNNLIDAGMSWPQISAASGVHIKVIENLLLGAGSGRAPSRRLRPDNAQALMTVPVPAIPPADGAAITDATRPRRELQALVASGRPLRFLARRSGLDLHTVVNIVHGRGPVRAGTAHTIHVLYGQLWDADPRADGIRPHDIRRAQQTAAARHWAPPLAWDDDTINDPAAVPDWTGRCGTTGGYYDHSQLGTPTCQPCRDAVNAAAAKRRLRRRTAQVA